MSPVNINREGLAAVPYCALTRALERTTHENSKENTPWPGFHKWLVHLLLQAGTTQREGNKNNKTRARERGSTQPGLSGAYLLPNYTSNTNSYLSPKKSRLDKQQQSHIHSRSDPIYTQKPYPAAQHSSHSHAHTPLPHSGL